MTLREFYDRFQTGHASGEPFFLNLEGESGVKIPEYLSVMGADWTTVAGESGFSIVDHMKFEQWSRWFPCWADDDRSFLDPYIVLQLSGD